MYNGVAVISSCTLSMRGSLWIVCEVPNVLYEGLGTGQVSTAGQTREHWQSD